METSPEKILKVLFAITKSNFGGAQRYVFDLATELSKQGFLVQVLCGGEGSLVSKLKDSNIQVISIGELQRDISFVRDLKSFIFILKTLERERPDVFHINSSKMGLGALAGRLVGIPKIIFTLHGFPWNENRPSWQKSALKCLTWLTIVLSNKTICVAEEARTIMKNWPFIQNKLVIIHNGVETFVLEEKNTARAKLVPNLANDTLLVGVASELHYIKGIDVLLRAWAKFKKDHAGELVILGSGEEKENLSTLTRSLSIQSSVHFKGHVDNARTLLKAFDIFVLPSRSEAMPYSILEAGYSGLPTIASSVGGIPEIIEDKVSGLLVPAEGEGQLLSALIYLADHIDQRERFGFALHKKIVQGFTLDKMVRDTIRAYANITS
ncbi:glycosyltransferase family 4 protein [soil metagenome]